MIQIIVISSLAAILSIAVQVSVLFKDKVILRRVYASVILIVPCLLSVGGIKPSFYALVAPEHTLSTLIFSAIVSALSVVVNLWAGKQIENTKVNPQIRKPMWTLCLFVQNGISWVVYLIAYEFLFRGYIFNSLLQHTSVGNAFIVSITLYALAHLFKGEKEFILSVPFGFILCYITLLTENVWAAVVIHSILAITNDIFAFRANPYFSMSFPGFKRFRYEK
ncbi:MAG TPA: CPBP family intramembrane glutamic endopeptidase [Chryseolinea sp.]